MRRRSSADVAATFILYAAAEAVIRSDARFFADAEAIYSYEGTREVNTLIVGRAITAVGAMV